MERLGYGADGYDGYGLDRLGFSRRGRIYCPVLQSHIARERCDDTRQTGGEMPEKLNILEKMLVEGEIELEPHK